MKRSLVTLFSLIVLFLGCTLPYKTYTPLPDYKGWAYEESQWPPKPYKAAENIIEFGRSGPNWDELVTEIRDNNGLLKEILIFPSIVLLCFHMAF